MIRIESLYGRGIMLPATLFYASSRGVDIAEMQIDADATDEEITDMMREKGLLGEHQMFDIVYEDDDSVMSFNQPESDKRICWIAYQKLG